MVVKINNKPMRVEEQEERTFSWTYLSVSAFGYLVIMYFADHVCRLFLNESPLPWLHNAVEWIGEIVQWFL